MKNERGMTLITVVVMVIVISVIAAASVFFSKGVFKESKEEVVKQNRFAVESVVQKYSAKMITSGVVTPANVELPGNKNPYFEHTVVDESGVESKVSDGVGNDWYLLLKEDLEEMGISYVDENYLVNYKMNIVIPLSETDDIFALVKYYEANY